MTDWRWPNFTQAEMACKCCGKAPMNPEFMDRLQALREAYGKPMAISSAYRCPDHNARVSGTGKNGPHTTGKAVDVRVSGADARRLLSLANDFPGIGVSQKGPHGSRFIHLDTIEDGPRPNVWSY